MPELKDIRTSLEVGFAEGAIPEIFTRYRGRNSRAIGVMEEFPFDDEQFQVVMLSASAVNAKMAREAHRVLKPEGRLYFIVPEKTKKQEGYTLPEIYSILRNGFDLTEVEKPRWRFLGIGKRTITICAVKKNWKNLTNRYRPYV